LPPLLTAAVLTNVRPAAASDQSSVASGPPRLKARLRARSASSVSPTHECSCAEFYFLSFSWVFHLVPTFSVLVPPLQFDGQRGVTLFWFLFDDRSSAARQSSEPGHNRASVPHDVGLGRLRFKRNCDARSGNSCPSFAPGPRRFMVLPAHSGRPARLRGSFQVSRVSVRGLRRGASDRIRAHSER
jgi:hypothetical protein